MQLAEQRSVVQCKASPSLVLPHPSVHFPTAIDAKPQARQYRSTSRAWNNKRCVKVQTTSADPVTVTSSHTNATHSQQQPAQASGPQLNWFEQWYPICFESDMDKTKLHRIEILSLPMVVWWDPNTTAWRVFADLCPHRLVPLSEGRVNKVTGHLECGYHGWQFEGSGACTRIPTGGNPSSARACATAYPCAVRQETVWVKPTPLPKPTAAADALADVVSSLEDYDRIPIVPELEENSDWISANTWRDVPLDYTTVFENTMDVSHVPWTHHKSISNRNDTGEFNLSLSEPPSLKGFTGHWPVGPKAGKLGPQNTYFTAPCFMKHQLDATKTRGYEALTIVYAVPRTPGHTRLVVRNCVRIKSSPVPRLLFNFIPTWSLHLSSQVPLEDDQIFLHIGEPEYMKRRAAGASVQKAYYLASPADAFVAGFRSWLDKYAGGGPFGPCTMDMVNAIGPRQPRSVLLDRYTQHVENCASCQKGLKQVRFAAKTLDFTVVVSSLLSIFCAAVGVARASLIGWQGSAGLLGTVNAATAAGTGVLASVSQLGLNLGHFLSGTGTPADQMLRAVVWASIALGAAYLGHKARVQEQKFFKGDYPPMRNTAKDP